jgi:hypothetical protein
MITNFANYTFKIPDVDEKTIRVENKERECYIDFYFDEKGRLDKIDDKWHIGVPDWYGYEISIGTIKTWAKKIDPRFEVFYRLQNDTNKYNL